MTGIIVGKQYQFEQRMQANQVTLQMQQLKSQELTSGIPNSIIITFGNEGLIYDLEIKLFQQQEIDHLRITIMNKSPDSQLYYESTFTMETLPLDFKAIYDSLPQLFDFILNNFQNALEIQFGGEGEENATLNIKVLIIKKVKQYKLAIKGKPLTQTMREEANLFKLNKQIETMSSLLTSLWDKNAQILKEKRIHQQQLQRLNQEEKSLVEDAAEKLQAEQIQREINAGCLSKMETIKLQIQAIFDQLSKEGYTFSKEQIYLFNSVLKEQPSNNPMKRFRHDEELQKCKEAKKNQKEEVNKEKPKEKSNEVKAPKEKEKATENIGQKKQEKEGGKVKAKVTISTSSKFKVEHQDEGQSMVKRHKRKLQIKDSEDISSEDKKEQARQANLSEKGNFIPFMQASSQNLDFANLGSSAKSSSLLRPAEQFVTVLSSESEEQQIEGYLKEIGKRVNLDFSSSQSLDKYKVQSTKSRTYIERVFDDHNFYHLYHRQAVTGKQNMQIHISQLNKNDLTFGIMGKKAVKVTRLQWEKDVVCWVGCSREVVNQIDNKKKDYWIQPSDAITVVADVPGKSVSFYVNTKLMHREAVEESIMNECYFFFQTASKGNKIYYYI